MDNSSIFNRSKGDEMKPHVHHWKIDSPDGSGVLTGRCKCNAIRTFSDTESIAGGKYAPSKIAAAEAAAKKRERKFVVKP